MNQDVPLPIVLFLLGQLLLSFYACGVIGYRMAEKKFERLLEAKGTQPK